MVLIYAGFIHEKEAGSTKATEATTNTITANHRVIKSKICLIGSQFAHKIIKNDAIIIISILKNDNSCSSNYKSLLLAKEN